VENNVCEIMESIKTFGKKEIRTGGRGEERKARSVSKREGAERETIYLHFCELLPSWKRWVK